MDKNAIIARGYATNEEYKEMAVAGLNKLNFAHSSGTEGIWYFPLEDDNKAGSKFHFVFHNDPISLMGSPRPIAGLVGVATSTGKSSRATAQIEECITLFERAGKPAIDYFWDAHKKSKKKAKK